MKQSRKTRRKIQESLGDIYIRSVGVMDIYLRPKDNCLFSASYDVKRPKLKEIYKYIRGDYKKLYWTNERNLIGNTYHNIFVELLRFIFKK